jgi:two-component system, OmpR family, alkaline phosphatase synthesis response regulator PhoP
MHESILLVEDEQALRTTLSDRLRAEKYVVETASDGNEGFDKASSRPFDLIIMDIMLPGRSGLDVCRDLRGAGMAIPIMILTVRNETVDKVVGLKLGADDYVTKPFEAAELLARVEVLLRRVPLHTGHGVYDFGVFQMDVRQGQVTRDGRSVYLTAREFQLLRYLVERSGSAIPRNELLRSVWGYSADVFTRTVDTHLFSLRKKLEENPKEPELLLTVSGVGYKFAGRERK